MRNVYLETVELEKAIEVFHDNIKEFLEEEQDQVIDARDSLGRISSKAIFSNYSSPSYHSASMDGVMIESSITKMARADKPLFIKNGDFKYCNTGNILEKPYDAVIMIEDVKVEEDGISILKPVNAWENIRLQGEDVVEKDLIYTAFHKFSATDTSVLLSCGIEKVRVLKQVKLAIIPTGNEIIDSGESLEKGKIIESNSAMLVAMAKEEGILSKVYPIVKDEEGKLKETIQKAVKENDFVCVLAGSSAGSKDFTKKVLEEMGQVFVHGIAIKPGKPAILAKVDNIPVVGLPGYPVSTHIIFDYIVLNTIAKKLKISPKTKTILKAKLTKQVISSMKSREYVRVKVGKIGQNVIATALDRKAGSLYSLAESDGYLIIDRNIEGYKAGDEVEITLHRPINEEVFQQRIIAIGSHDIVLDVINDMLALKGKKTRIISSHVGSLSGLKALSDGNCHLAPSHLLDKDGGYNKEAIDLFFEKDEVVRLSVVGRRQGIFVQKQNPLNIKSIKDLVGKTMVNRQRGAGTRVLFDYLLRKEGIDSSDVTGYDNEVTTHLQAALAVKNGDCDFSVGVESAAIKMDVDFIYLKDEEYQFVVKNENLNSKAIEEIREILKSEEFKENMIALGGYTVSESGQIKGK